MPDGTEALDAPGVPKHRQLADRLRGRAEAGEWAADAALPTEEELCRSYGVSRITVRQALQALVLAGLVYRVQGRGTYASGARLERDIGAVYSFSADMRRLGLEPGSEVLSLEERDDAPACLGLEAGARAFRLVRLRKADGRALLLETTWVPAALCPDLGSLDFRAASLYAVLSERGFPPRRARESYEATLLDAPTARLLGCAGRGPHPALRISRIAFLSDGRAAECTEAYGRGDRTRLAVDLADAASARTRGLEAGTVPAAERPMGYGC